MTPRLILASIRKLKDAPRCLLFVFVQLFRFEGTLHFSVSFLRMINQVLGFFDIYS